MGDLFRVVGITEGRMRRKWRTHFISNARKEKENYVRLKRGEIEINHILEIEKLRLIIF